jgi:hypothetical protein
MDPNLGVLCRPPKAISDKSAAVHTEFFSIRGILVKNTKKPNGEYQIPRSLGFSVPRFCEREPKTHYGSTVHPMRSTVTITITITDTGRDTEDIIRNKNIG